MENTSSFLTDLMRQAGKIMTAAIELQCNWTHWIA